MSWSPGDVIVYRHRSYDGRYLSGFPLSIIEATPSRIVGALPHGTVISRPVADDGADLRSIPLEERWARPRKAKLSPFTLTGADDRPGRLIIVFPLGRAYSLWIFRDPDRVQGWYMNLEEPQTLGERTISTTDHVLDIWVPGDTGEPRWKDEDELAAAVTAGVQPGEMAEAIRTEGERIIRERPWPTGFEDAIPSPHWPLPELFAGWDVA